MKLIKSCAIIAVTGLAACVAVPILKGALLQAAS